MPTKIKICDIRDIDTARYCYEKGVSFLGLHVIQENMINNERLALYQRIRDELTRIGLVLVTKITNPDTLVMLCKKVKFDYLQLHPNEKINMMNVIEIREIFRMKQISIKIINVRSKIDIDSHDIKQIAQVSDYLLFDSSLVGGTGNIVNDEKLFKILPFIGDKKYFIAGGLNQCNVSKIIHQFRPFAVDVQSGVENPRHYKNKALIDLFINAVRQADST